MSLHVKMEKNYRWSNVPVRIRLGNLNRDGTTLLAFVSGKAVNRLALCSVCPD